MEKHNGFPTDYNTPEDEIIRGILKSPYLGVEQILLAGDFNTPSVDLGRQDVTVMGWLH